jgi:hypothetical protein
MIAHLCRSSLTIRLENLRNSAIIIIKVELRYKSEKK